MSRREHRLLRAILRRRHDVAGAAEGEMHVHANVVGTIKVQFVFLLQPSNRTRKKMSFGDFFGEMNRRQEFQTKLPQPGLAFLDGAISMRFCSTRPP